MILSRCVVVVALFVVDVFASNFAKENFADENTAQKVDQKRQRRNKTDILAKTRSKKTQKGQRRWRVRARALALARGKNFVCLISAYIIRGSCGSAPTKWFIG